MKTTLVLVAILTLSGQIPGQCKGTVGAVIGPPERQENIVLSETSTTPKVDLSSQKNQTSTPPVKPTDPATWRDTSEDLNRLHLDDELVTKQWAQKNLAFKDWVNRNFAGKHSHPFVPLEHVRNLRETSKNLTESLEEISGTREETTLALQKFSNRLDKLQKPPANTEEETETKPENQDTGGRKVEPVIAQTQAWNLVGLIALIILLSLIVAGLLLAGKRRLQLFYRRKEILTITSEACGWNGGRKYSARSAVPTSHEPTRFEVARYFCNLSSGSEWYSHQTDPTTIEESHRAQPGDIIQLKVVFRNNSGTVIPAEQVVITEKPDRNEFDYVKGTAICRFNNNVDWRLPDVMALPVLQNNKGLPLSEAVRVVHIPNWDEFKGIPAHGSFAFQYNLRRRDHISDELGFPGETVTAPTTPPEAPPTTGPAPKPISSPPVVGAAATVAKPAETPTEIVERLRKDVLGGDYRITDDLRTHLEGIGKEDDIRKTLVAYQQARSKLLDIDKGLNRRSDYRKAGDFAARVVLKQLATEKASDEYRGTSEQQATVGQVGSAEDAIAGLAAGLRGGVR